MILRFICLAGVLMTSTFSSAADDVIRTPFGKTKEGDAVDIFTLQNSKGMKVRLITFGATIQSIEVPDNKGKMADVIVGFDTLEGFLTEHPYFGGTIGRVCNRIGNAKFSLDGKEYSLAANNGPHSLHGGKKGFDRKNWTAESFINTNDRGVRFTRTSPDGEEGYPGNVRLGVTFTLTNDNALRIEYDAITDKSTPINLTNHAYFNLAGSGNGTILDHQIMINATQQTATDETLIPTGKLAPVAGTPIDFTKYAKIGARIKEIKATPVGYDHNYVLEASSKDLKAPAAVVREPNSGRVMEVYTTEPGLQFYTGNFLDGTIKGKKGAVYNQYNGFCLESQHYPDSVNKKEFPSTILKPGEKFSSTTTYKFLTVVE
jgi:aldose 1-epimerase